MLVTLVSGSQRKSSQSAKVMRFLARLLEQSQPGTQTHCLQLGVSPLPWYDDDDNTENSDFWQPIRERLEQSDAFVFVSPEWNGMVTPALKNFFLYCSTKAMAHKPALLVGVSESRGGAYPIAELSMSGYKNKRFCAMPEHLIVRNAVDVMNEGAPTSKDDVYIRDRARYAADLLVEYAKALKTVRASGIVNHEKYGNGM